MFQILALTTYKQMFESLQEIPGSEFEVKVFEEPLPFVDALLSLENGMVILDIDLMQEKTLELIQIIQKVDRQLPIVMILSKEHMKICLSTFSMGISKYLVKPITSKCLRILLDATKLS